MIRNTKKERMNSPGTRRIKLNIKKAIGHSVCWTCFIAYEIFLYYYAAGANSLSSMPKYFIYYAINISLFYTQVTLLNSAIRDGKVNYLRFGLLSIAVMIIFLALKLAADLVLTNFALTQAAKFRTLKAMAVLDLLRLIYFEAFGALYWTVRNIGSYQRKAALAENAYLRQQINPHLLFNSLNFIYNKISQSSPDAAENILLLSDIVRFSLRETEPDGKLSVADEEEQIENLILINRSRFHYPLDITFSKSGDFKQARIIPLVLLTLTENVFKHGDLREKPAIISLEEHAGQLLFRTFNHRRPPAPAERTSRLGLENTRIRLNFAYGENGYRLNITETDDTFTCELIIP